MRLFLLSLLCAGLAGPALSGTIRVPGDQPTIQAGINAAQAGDEVQVACGTYFEHDLVMRSGFVLRSETGDPGCVTVDAGGVSRVLSCSGVDAATVIEGFRFTGGYRTGPGESRGGAILLVSSFPTIRHCIFDRNEASGGGGGLCADHSNPFIDDCVFSRNAGIDGGGLLLNHSSPVVRQCVFHDNDCMFWGGAIACENSSEPTFINCTLVRNHAYQGGGIWCVYESRPVFRNCLIAFSAQGEGVYNYSNPGHQSVITLSCSDVYGNAGGNYGGEISDQTGLDGNISSDPLFCDPASDDFSLGNLSPCLPGQNECQVRIGALGEGCDVAGAPGPGVQALRPTLTGSVPNPFGRSTRVTLRLFEPAAVTLRIFDLQGREVRRLARQVSLPAGETAVSWDGRDDAGRPLASGVYLCRFESSSLNETLRISLVR